jgi:hypothetical protein
MTVPVLVAENRYGAPGVFLAQIGSTDFIKIFRNYLQVDGSAVFFQEIADVILFLTAAPDVIEANDQPWFLRLGGHPVRPRFSSFFNAFT